MTRAGHEAWPDGSFVQQLPDADRVALLDAGTPLRFEDDQILLVQGDAGDFLYVLTSGLVKVIVAAVSGAQTTLAIRSRGDLVGEFALLDDKPRTATARAAGPVTALKIGGAAFLAIAGRSPAVQAAVTRYLLAKMRAATERRAAERIWDARERLAQVLYELGQQHAQPDADGMIRIPDHAERARRAGGRGGVDRGAGAEGPAQAGRRQHALPGDHHQGHGLPGQHSIFREKPENPLPAGICRRASPLSSLSGDMSLRRDSPDGERPARGGGRSLAFTRAVPGLYGRPRRAARMRRAKGSSSLAGMPTIAVQWLDERPASWIRCPGAAIRPE